ncbi:MAG: right-handed parallel beta-helix repeat-containing protein [Bryobacterales bacterium]|nr:right-handed parallel beta-helix repeat-containing protein [Bryobacterales bacterium]
MVSLLLLSAVITVTPAGGVRAFEEARDRIRASGEAGEVRIVAGDYFVDRTIVLDAREPAGSVYKAEPGARFVGGVRLRDWRRVTDGAVRRRLSPEARKNVVVHRVANAGALQARGFGRARMAAHSELFFEGERMTVARWPNGDFTRIAESLDTEAPDDGHGKKLGRLPNGFRYAGDRPAGWKPDNNIWVHGYWAWDWADSYERVATLDTKTRAITTAPPYGLYGFRGNQRFYFLNVLEELDAPGEYYVDAAAGRVYFWPPSDPRRAEVFLSQMEAPVFHIRDAKLLTLDGIHVEATRGAALRIDGGAGVTLTNTRLRNIGSIGLTMEGGREHTVARCEIAFTGDSAIEITGGDRATMTAADHSVTDCDIHHMGQWVRTYNPAVKVNGVGIRVAHNHIHDAPHAGILLTGNEHLIEFNNIHHLALETGDVGAIYIGRDYTERGTIIRHNYIHDLGGVGFGSMAVYLDDCSSGITVEGNIFHNLKYGAFVGGGRDNRIHNNVFVACHPAVRVDGRGIDPSKVWQNMVYNIMRPKVLAAPHFLDKYPELRTVLPYFDKPGGVPPEGNSIRGNLIHGEGIVFRQGAQPFVKDIEGNVTMPDASFFNPATGAYAPPAEGPHQRIPFEKIGPRR